MQTQLPHAQALQLILAGRAYITFKNGNTGNRFTYKIHKCLKQDDKGDDIFYIYVFTGRDNDDDSSYSYIGSILHRCVFYPGKTSKIARDDVKVKVFDYVFSHLVHKTLPFFIEIWHEGRCLRCGRKMTVPESIRDGLGPECYYLTTGGKPLREKTTIKANTHNHGN